MDMRHGWPVHRTGNPAERGRRTRRSDSLVVIKTVPIKTSDRPLSLPVRMARLWTCPVLSLAGHVEMGLGHVAAGV